MCSSVSLAKLSCLKEENKVKHCASSGPFFLHAPCSGQVGGGGLLMCLCALRFTQPPADLWDWFEPYLDDEEVSVVTITSPSSSPCPCLPFPPPHTLVFIIPLLKIVTWSAMTTPSRGIRVEQNFRAIGKWIVIYSKVETLQHNTCLTIQESKWFVAIIDWKIILWMFEDILCEGVRRCRYQMAHLVYPPWLVSKKSSQANAPSLGSRVSPFVHLLCPISHSLSSIPPISYTGDGSAVEQHPHILRWVNIQLCSC